MFQNYVMSAFRGLRRQRLFAAINVVGLGIGIAACTLIVLFVHHEFSYDASIPDVDRIYRIEATANIPGQPSNESPRFFGPTYDLLPSGFAEVEAVARLQQRGGTVVKDDSSIPETFALVDPEFLVLFPFPVVEGSLEGALSEPASAVLTESMAIKHLGRPPWVGRTLVVNETIEREQTVTAVIEDLPGTTHFDIDILLPIDRRVYESVAAFGATDLDRWNGLQFNVYVKLNVGATPDNLEAGINDWVDSHFPARIQALVGINGSELFTPRIMPVRDIHMESPVQFDMRPPGSRVTIYSFAGIALLMLFIACINFVNLATATSILRAREVAMRKVMGATRAQLFWQFQFESLVTALFSLLLALVAIEMVLPAFSEYTDRVLTSADLFEPGVIGLVLLLTVGIGLVAGVYPAVVLSGFRPARVLKANQPSATGNAGLRAVLVLFQFAISAGLIISTLLIYVQTDHARTIDMGYENSDVLTVRGLFRQQIGDGQAEVVRDEVARMPGVRRSSLSSFSPGDGRNTGLSLKVPGIDDRVIIFYRSVYPAFFSQFDVTPVAGRLLDDSHPGDRTTFIDDPDSTERQDANVVINETAVRMLGFGTPAEAIGNVYYRGQANQIVSTVVGVIPDIHFGSPRAEVDAEIFMYIPSEVRNLLVTYDGVFSDVSQRIEVILRDRLPRAQTPVQHLQDNIAQQYREEEVQSTLLALFSGLAILIACMGLFGLASFTIARRTKEIGLRKVMGASPSEIIMLLLRQFSTPVLIANVIAWPFCWYAVSEWLTGFNNRIDLLPWFAAVVAVSVAATVALAWMTVASHAWRVARTSPVSALRYE